MTVLALPSPTLDDLAYLITPVHALQGWLVAVVLLLTATLRAFLRWCDLTGVGTPSGPERGAAAGTQLEDKLPRR